MTKPTPDNRYPFSWNDMADGKPNEIDDYLVYVGDLTKDLEPFMTQMHFDGLKFITHNETQLVLCWGYLPEIP